MKKNLLFDLDGTLADPFVSFSLSIRHAFGALGFAQPTDGQIKSMIGPSLLRSVPEILGIKDSEMVLKILEVYREHHARTCVEHYVMYPGFHPILKDLTQRHRVFVCTSKPVDFAKPILKAKGYDHYFRQIYGSELSNKNSDKADLIKDILKIENLNPADCIMIGDRKHDAEAAHKNQVSAVGVAWGYGSLEELKNSGVKKIFHSVADLNF